MPMSSDLQAQVDEATFHFTMGDHGDALAILDQVLAADAAFLPAWHAKAEIHFDQRELDAALEAGKAALALAGDDVHIHTTLSRIWMERGDKAEAEKHGAQARMLGWKAELKGETEDT